MTPKAEFFAKLRLKIHTHQADVNTVFKPLRDTSLTWQPNSKEWSILLCFDHLIQTYAYYQAKLEQALTAPIKVQTILDTYRPSVWGRIYMAFALNPHFSFPTPDALRPTGSPQRVVLEQYLIKQQEMLNLLETLEEIDLNRTRIPIEKNVAFNLGDCVKILVYHDSLHIRQAYQVHKKANEALETKGR